MSERDVFAGIIRPQKPNYVANINLTVF